MSKPKLAPQHSSYERLVAALGAAHPGKSLGTTAIGALFNGSPQLASNWRARGVPIESAVEAQRRWGVNAVWVLYGEGQMLISSPDRSQTARFDDETFDQAVELLHYMSIARPDDRRFSRPNWAMIQRAAKAIAAGGGDERKAVTGLLGELETTK